MTRFVRFSPERVPRNVVTVRVWKSMGRAMADVVAPLSGGDGSALVAEMPRPVPAALRRASEMSLAAHADRVAVVIDEDTLWNDDWGALR